MAIQDKAAPPRAVQPARDFAQQIAAHRIAFVVQPDPNNCVVRASGVGLSCRAADRSQYGRDQRHPGGSRWNAARGSASPAGGQTDAFRFSRSRAERGRGSARRHYPIADSADARCLHAGDFAVFLAVSFTPAQRGKHRVLVVTSAGQFLGEGWSMCANPTTTARDSTSPDFGTTREPNGSGLTFHSQPDDGQPGVPGPLVRYGADGVARWFTIQNTRWVLQREVLEGDLYETRSAAVAARHWWFVQHYARAPPSSVARAWS